jgi:long-chain acyl-CoA synthetase
MRWSGHGDARENIAELFLRSAKRAGERPAVALGPHRLWSYADLVSRAAAIAGSLVNQLGLARGDRVALAMRNLPEYVELLLACWWGGFVAVPINARLHRNELAWIVEHSGARLLFVADDLAPALGDLPEQIQALERLFVAGAADQRKLLNGDRLALADVAADELAWLFYTSGTTGRPKGAMISHGNLRAMTAAYVASVDGAEPGDAMIHMAPLSHGSGLYLLPQAAEAAVQVIPEGKGFDEAEFFALVAAHARARTFAAPTMVKRLVRWAEAHAPDTRNLETIVYGGAPMYLADLDAAHAVLGFRLAQIYGQGESPMTITALPKQVHADKDHPRWRERLGSAGTPQQGIELVIRDEEGAPVPTGEMGEVTCRGPSVVRGYWRDPEASRRTMGDGWLRTGDMGSLDEDGFLTLKDRSKDLIISGGANVYPREVEEVLLGHPAVREVAVVGVPDAEWGERVVACVVADRHTSCKTLDAHCLARIARFKRPREYVFMERLPKNNYGKVLKRVLKEALTAKA